MSVFKILSTKGMINSEQHLPTRKQKVVTIEKQHI